MLQELERRLQCPNMPAVALGRLQHAAFSFSFGAKVKPEMAMWIFTLCSMKGFSLWPSFPCQVFSPDTVYSIKYFLHLSISFTDVEPLPLSAWKTIHFFISSQIFIFSKKRSQLSLVQRSFSSHYFPCHRLYELFLELRWCEDQLGKKMLRIPPQRKHPEDSHICSHMYSFSHQLRGC